MRLFFNFGIVLLAMAALWGCNPGKEVTGPEKSPGLQALSHTEQAEIQYLLVEAVKNKNLGNFEDALYYINSILKIDAENGTAHFQRAQVLYHVEDYPAAVKAAENAVNKQPENIWFRRFLLQLYEHTGNNDALLGAAKDVLALTDASSSDFVRAAQYAIQLDAYQEAVDIVGKHDGRYGIRPKTAEIRGSAFFELGQGEKGKKAFQELLAKYKGEPRLYGLYAEYLQDEGKYRESLKVLEEGLLYNPDNGRLNLTKAITFLELKKLEKAYQALQVAFQDRNTNVRLKTATFVNHFYDYMRLGQYNEENGQVLAVLKDAHPSDTQVQLIYTDFLLANEKFREAQQSLRGVLENYHSDFELWQQLFVIELKRSDYKALKEDSETAMAYFLNQPDVYYYNGLANFFLENYQSAVLSLNDALYILVENKQKKFLIHNYLAEAYYRLEEYEDAFFQFDKAIGLAPDDITLKNNYSYYLAQQGQDLDKALQLIQEVVAAKPENITFLDTHAWVLYKRGEYMQARDVMQKAIDTGKSPSAVILEHYGDILEAVGDTDGAHTYYKKALELDPSREHIKKKIENLAQ